ncbi:hypothetical protein V6Z11_D03G115100 [Gossypium hirsutum]
MNSLPSVNHAYSMLMQEESQRKHSSSNIEDDLVHFSSVQMIQKKQFNGTCDHCKVKGHKRETCYKLIGYPADFKFTKGSEVVNSIGSHSQAPVFTQEQYHQILNLLNKKPATVEAAASLAGMVDIGNRWIIDTGATDHILSDLHFLESPVACALGSPCVRLLNGSSVSVTHVGTCTVLPNLHLTRVLYVPNFRYNILSVSKLTTDLNCMVSFYPHFCLIQDLSSGKMRGIGKVRGGLYFLDPSQQTLVIPPSSIAANASIDSFFLWHTRLGHASISRLNKAPNFPCTVSDVDSIHKCSVCPLAK